jgi:hypothetical protein
MHSLALAGQFATFQASWEPAGWHSACATWDQMTGRLILVADGETLLNTTVEGNRGTKQSDQLHVEILGELDGQLTDLQMWNHRINSKKVPEYQR